MKILYLVNGGPHGHSYGADNLFTGLVNELGFAHVLDWPEKPPLHCAIAERTHFDVPQRDGCNIDSDAAYPYRATHPTDFLDADLAIIALPPDAVGLGQIAEVCRALPRSTPIAALDASDWVDNYQDWYEALAGRPLAAYFKREYPIGAHWPGTFPCPLSYPESRAFLVPWEYKRGVFYHATNHGERPPGVPRHAIRRRLLGLIAANHAVMDVPFDIALTQSQENRLSPEDYHEYMAQALIGISWNGAPNWDCNRFWENLAYGLCQVAERPRIQIPHVPLDAVHCFYADTPESVAEIAWRLLNDEPTARRVATAGHDHFVMHHSSEARARYILSVVGQRGAC